MADKKPRRQRADGAISRERILDAATEIAVRQATLDLQNRLDQNVRCQTLVVGPTMKEPGHQDPLAGHSILLSDIDYGKLG